MVSSRPALNYTLRPAKNIERKMMCEALSRLGRIAPLSGYRYVGLGSEFFNDFALYHQRLGIRKMVSIERDELVAKRCHFNRPFKCIDVRQGASSEVLPQLSWTSRTIIWLDYTDPLEAPMLEDVALVASNAVSGSVLIVTVKASYRPDGAAQDVKASNQRLLDLSANVGEARVPVGVKGAELAKWGLASVFHRIITNELQTTLTDRNGALPKDKRIVFQQCFHFNYSDTTPMLTIGGVLLDAADKRSLGKNPFHDLQFVREGAAAMLIAPPMLTTREIRHLNQSGPDKPKGGALLEWLTDEQHERYREVYRYFPVFAESEL